MNNRYKWNINNEGEIEVRDDQGKLVVQTGVEIGSRLMCDENFKNTVLSTYLRLTCPSDQGFIEYARSEKGYETIQYMAKSLLTDYGK